MDEARSDQTPLDRSTLDQAQGGYPANWEADVVLSDGGTAHVRPILPTDADRLERFYSRLSPETIYFRFFAPYPKLSAKDVVRFTTVDHDDRAALIVLVGEEMVGVVRYDRVSPRRRRSRSTSRTPTRAAVSVRSCWSTSRPPPASGGSSASPPRCCPPTDA